MMNLGAIRTGNGTVRRGIQETGGGAVVAAGERRHWRDFTRGWGFGADTGDERFNVDAACEGFTMVAADFIRNFEGDLKTVALPPVLLPVGQRHNSDFGKPNHLNAAAKLYLL